MPSTVFGDFACTAADELRLAQQFAMKGQTSTEGTAAIVGASTRLVKTLTRYADLKVDTSSNETWHGMRVAYEHLSTLEKELDASGWQCRHPVARHIDGCAVSLGIGLDLLKTHHTPDGTANLTDWANAICHPDVQLAIGKLVRDGAQQLGTVLHQVQPALRSTSLEHVHHALRSLGVSAEGVAVQHGQATLKAVPLYEAPTLEPLPGVHLSISDLFRDITAKTEAIRTLAASSTGDATDQRWQLHAIGAAGTLHSAMVACNLLLRRSTEISPDCTQLAQRLLAGGHRAVQRVYTRWNDVRGIWDKWATTTLRKAPSDLEVHLKHLVICTRRMVSADPGWTFGQSRATMSRIPAQLALHMADMPTVLMTVLRTVDALRVVAEYDLSRVEQAVRHGRLLRSGVTPPVHAADLDNTHVLAAYRDLVAHSHAAIPRIENAIITIVTPGSRPAFGDGLATLGHRRDPKLVKAMYDFNDRETSGLSNKRASILAVLKESRLALQAGKTPPSAENRSSANRRWGPGRSR
ncbi:hypothetical protein [Sinosporangium siamense]|uniref:Uncharacterized protein n=1 Tax=Sinosporangium siamense TaxID=1367973 RepID=A0A919RMB1_9ACTN|nr:hypothetical protein [Sinosporangium siamense]GII96373.1 hypothetical protein Ssi02_66040 [Sinosporangium siamense]